MLANLVPLEELESYEAFSQTESWHEGIAVAPPTWGVADDASYASGGMPEPGETHDAHYPGR